MTTSKNKPEISYCTDFILYLFHWVEIHLFDQSYVLFSCFELPNQSRQSKIQDPSLAVDFTRRVSHSGNHIGWYLVPVHRRKGAAFLL
jgi:hypothetical protein